MGNTVVVKPASATPLSALALADLALEAGLPEGVLNVVTGSGSVAGNALATHPLVRKISFTGSTEIGVGVMKQAADGIKRVSLELGGKSANIVFADARIDQCVESSLWAVYDNAGQDCCSRSRILVERPIYDEFVEKFVNRTKTMKVGSPTDESTEMGPLITPHIAIGGQLYPYWGRGRRETAVWWRNPRGALAKGNFLTPAVYSGCHYQHADYAGRNFWPGGGIMPFDGEAEAINLPMTRLMAFRLLVDAGYWSCATCGARR